MTLDQLVQQGWADHAEHAADVADRIEQGLGLVEDAKGAAGFMSLVNHTVGDHLGDRTRAARINEAAADRVGASEETGHLVQLAASRELAGDPKGAAEVAGRLGTNPGIDVQIGMLVAQGHMHAGDWDAAAALYRDTLAKATSLPPGHAGERSVAVVSNNIASEALGCTPVSDTQAALMAEAADAARTFWTRIGTWVNAERADYLLALVHNKLGRPADGRRHAEQGLRTIEQHGEENVDQAFLWLARAGACRAEGDDAAYTDSLAMADALAAAFGDPGLEKWFQEERAKVG